MDFTRKEKAVLVAGMARDPSGTLCGVGSRWKWNNLASVG